MAKKMETYIRCGRMTAKSGSFEFTYKKSGLDTKSETFHDDSLLYRALLYGYLIQPRKVE